MTIDAPAVADAIEAALRQIGTPGRAAAEKRYLKSDLEFLGATVWEIRRVARAVAREHRDLQHGELIALVEALWEPPIHERRMAAVMLLDSVPGLLGPPDLDLVERLIRESRTWALVDELAGDVAGRIVRDRPQAATVLDRWSTDADFWVRRASLLAELIPLRAGAPFDRFARRADAMLDEHEFFIRKAMGWVLREAGKRRPDEVVAWLAPRTDRVSGVTIREAVKYLPDHDRLRLISAYKEGRAAS